MNACKTFSQHPRKFVALTALVGALVGVVIAATAPARFYVSLDFTINQHPTQPTSQYDYGGYYALKAEELFGDTLISWFATPSVLGDIYAAAGLPITPETSVEIADGYRAKKLSTQNVVISFYDTNKGNAELIAKSAVAVVNRKTSQLNLNSKGDSLFTVAAADPVIAETKLPLPRAAGIGLILGALAGFISIYLLTPPKKETA